MAPHPNPSESITAPSSTLSSQMPQESQSGLPGLKRGIAIGVAACVAIILIALLAFFAIRRRKRLASQKSPPKDEIAEAPNNQTWPQEKCRGPSPPPVEADARTIYEMDADQIPELPSYTQAPEKELDGQEKHDSSSSNEIEKCTQDQKSRQQQEISIKTHDNSILPQANRQLPLLTISPSEGQSGDISPLLRSSWDASSPSPSTGSVSPLAEAHVRNRQFEEV